MLFGEDDSPKITLTDVTVGQHLQAAATVNVIHGPLTQDIEITVTSGDPAHVLLAANQEDAGKPSIVLLFKKNLHELQFYVQGLDKSGVITYTASAPNVISGSAKATLAPSGWLIAGPYGTGKPSFLTTTGVPKSIAVYTARLDSSMAYVASQPLAGGRNVSVKLNSSDEKVGALGTTSVRKFRVERSGRSQRFNRPPQARQSCR